MFKTPLLPTIHQLQHSCGSRAYKKVVEMIGNPNKSCVLFNNEFHQECYQMRELDESLDEWRERNIRAACNWYHSHLDHSQPIICVTGLFSFADCKNIYNPVQKLLD